jgi:hypothetical protein
MSAAAVGAALLPTPPAAGASEIRVAGGSCAARVTVVARDARLSDVLQRLAKAYDFKLSFESATDPVVNYSGSAELTNLVTRLAPRSNLSMLTAPMARCARRERLAVLWVLPDAPRQVRPSPGVAVVDGQSPSRGAPATTDAPVDPLYWRAHGATQEHSDKSR